ncbi:MAG: MATE family efflux transporter [Lachnospiraceae bacterium]|nr:MATE family efflux transporter [Lachnospiraceae bacterium]
MEHKMTSGKISSTILKFAAPILIGQILQQLYNIIDSIIVGRYIGVEALAAVGATWSLSYIVCYFCIGTCMGISVPLSQEYGAGNMKRIKEGLGCTVKMGILYSLAVIVIIFFAGDFLALLFVNADNMVVIGYTRKFLFYISFFHLELAVLFAFRYCVQGMGYGRFSIYSGTAEMLGRALVAIFLVPVFGFEAVCWNEGVTFLAGIAVIVPLYFWIERKFIE